MNITLELTASPSLLEAFKLLASVFTNPSNGIISMPGINQAASLLPEVPGIIEAPQTVIDARSVNETDRREVGASATTTATTTQTDLTVEQVRAATQAKAKSGKRSEVKALLSKYGTDSVTNMDAANYAAFYAELEAL